MLPCDFEVCPAYGITGSLWCGAGKGSQQYLPLCFVSFIRTSLQVLLKDFLSHLLHGILAPHPSWQYQTQGDRWRLSSACLRAVRCILQVMRPGTPLFTARRLCDALCCVMKQVGWNSPKGLLFNMIVHSFQQVGFVRVPVCFIEA